MFAYVAHVCLSYIINLEVKLNGPSLSLLATDKDKTVQVIMTIINYKAKR